MTLRFREIGQCGPIAEHRAGVDGHVPADVAVAPDDRIGIERFKLMERKLYFGIMAPGAILTVVFGMWMWLGYGVTGTWLHAKVTFVLVLIAFHVYLGFLLRDFARDRNRHGHVFYRWLNEIPALPLLVIIAWLVVAKPF